MLFALRQFRAIAGCFALLLVVVSGYAENEVSAKRLALAGFIRTTAGAPIKDATIFIYSAQPKTGTSTFCPTCYVDCGKSEDSDARGGFTITGLSPDLLFRVLVVAKGYRPQFVEQVDPANKHLNVTLEPAALGTLSPDHILRGKVTDAAHTPIRGAVVQAHGIFTSDGKGYWGQLRGVDPFAVTDGKGEFALASQEAFVRMDVRLSARGFANRTVTQLRSGSNPQTMVMTEGVTLSGRVTLGGRPQRGISVGVVSVDRGVEKFTGHFEIATDDAGRFSFFNLPPNTDYYVYGLMESIGKLGAIPARKVHAGADGQTANAGDLAIEPGHRVAGRVVLGDGQHLPPQTRLLLSRKEAWDTLEVDLESDGSFEIRGVSSEVVDLTVQVRGYHPSAKNGSFDTLNGGGLTGRVERDVVGLEVLLEKGPAERPVRNSAMTEADWKALPQNYPLRGAENPTRAP